MVRSVSPMPEIARFVEALREAFGADEINAIVRRGRAGEPVFFAREGGMEFGTPLATAAGWDARRSSTATIATTAAARVSKPGCAAVNIVREARLGLRDKSGVVFAIIPTGNVVAAA